MQRFAFRRRGLAALAIWLSAAPVAMVRAESTGTAADLVPADCVYFSSALRLKEQVDAIHHSPAFTKRLLPLLKKIWTQAQAEADNNPQAKQALAMLQDPGFKKGAALAWDLGSREVFFYVDGDWLRFMEKFQDLPGRIQAAMIGSLMTGGKAKPERIYIPALVEFAVNSKLKLPPFVFGFKASDPKQIEDLLEQLREAGERKNVKIEKVSVGAGKFSTLKLTGKMVTADKEDKLIEALTEVGVTEQSAKSFYEWLSQQTAAITIGVHGEYVIVSVAADNEHLSRLGKGPLLCDSPRLAPIRDHIKNGKLISLSYKSLELASFGATDVAQQRQQIDAGMGMAKLFMPPGLGDRLIKDLKQLVADVDAVTPKPSETLAISLLNKGVESYRYTRSIVPGTDYSRPLTVLQHVGGKPFFAAAGSSTSSLAGYAKGVEYLKKFYGYAHDFALPKLEEAQKQKVRKYEQVVLPFLAEIDAVTAKKFLPAVDAGQTAFVLDFLTKAKTFPAGDLPEAAPVPELALVFAINDGDLLKTAIADYTASVSSFYEKLRPLAEEDGSQKLPPTLPIAAPQHEAAGESTKYYYPLPFPLDPALQPHALLSKRLLILSNAPRLSGAAQKAGEQPKSELVGVDEPSADAMLLHPAPLYAAARDWLALVEGLPNSPMKQMKPEDKETFDLAIGAASDVAATFKGTAVRIFKKGEYQVTHGWCHFDDAAK